jgi:DNA-binding XRE family transcriptional regulator
VIIINTNTDAKQIREVFAQRLKEIREERGFSQEDVGRMAGLSKATISKYEAASHPPKLKCGGCRARAYYYSNKDYMAEDEWCLYRPKGARKHE